jgi:hypothetical protein
MNNLGISMRFGSNKRDASSSRPDVKTRCIDIVLMTFISVLTFSTSYTYLDQDGYPMEWTPHFALSSFVI